MDRRLLAFSPQKGNTGQRDVETGGMEPVIFLLGLCFWSPSTTVKKLARGHSCCPVLTWCLSPLPPSPGVFKQRACQSISGN